MVEPDTKFSEKTETVQGQLVVTMIEMKNLITRDEPSMSKKKKETQIQAVVDVQLVDHNG
jgi:hypothetical protein